MKSFSIRTTQDSEILQLFLLDEIFALHVSRKLLFQGGTCLRWAYAGTRYSEDLDFLAKGLESQEVVRLKSALGKGLEKKVAVQFGPGALEIQAGDRTEGLLHTIRVKYQREGERRKIAVKIEIQEAGWEKAENFVLRQIPEVSRFLLEAVIRVPFGRSVVLCSPAEEILAEKIKCLVKRDYVKGRDLYDIWFLTRTLRISVLPGLVVERTKAYPGKFVARRSLKDFLDTAGNKDFLDALEELHRFLPPGEMGVLRKEGYQGILLAVEKTVGGLLEKGLHERIIACADTSR